MVPFRFDYDLFDRLVAREYHDYQRTEDPPCPWTLQEITSVLHLFFRTYENMTGEWHPPLRLCQIEDCIRELPRIITDETGERSVIELYPEDYSVMIEEYFQKTYRGRDDHRIFHFLSGDIRLYLVYECGLI